jgi:hypothetical protein
MALWHPEGYPRFCPCLLLSYSKRKVGFFGFGKYIGLKSKQSFTYKAFLKARIW